jgi:NADPH:quinone reductase-like Zn-dependent oxidoreductase
MKAAVVSGYGGPHKIRIRDVPKPDPGPGELLVRVRAATVNRTDCGELYPRPFFGRVLFGLRRPRPILGLDFAGDVEATGSAVTLFQAGARVFGMCPMRRNGAHAEYVCMPEDGALAEIPAGMPYAQAVVCEGAFYAEPGLARLGVGRGHKILIYGASGAIGTAALQLAKYRGAEVTAVVATKHLELVRALGADHVIDYTREDYTRVTERFDSIFDAVGKANYLRCRRLLKPGGTFATTDLGPKGMNAPLLLWSWLSGSHRVIVGLPPRGSAPAFVRFLKERLERKELRAVIDRTYVLDDIAEAFRYVDTGQKTGIVVIAVAP